MPGVDRGFASATHTVLIHPPGGFMFLECEKGPFSVRILFANTGFLGPYVCLLTNPSV